MKVVRETKEDQDDRLVRALRIVVVTALFVLVILLTYSGLIIISGLYEPAQRILVGNPIMAFRALVTQQELSQNPYRVGYWYPPVSERKGLVTYLPGKAYNGLTLYISVEEPKAMLIDMEGTIVHQWAVPFDALYGGDEEGSPHLYKWTRSHLGPDGTLFVIYEGPERSGLLKLDRDSRILWKFIGAVHHDIAVSESGVLYTLLKKTVTSPHPAVPHIAPPFIQDFVIALDNAGKETGRILLLDAFIDSPAENMLSQLLYDPTGSTLNPGDLIHPNSIEIIRKPEAGKAPMLVEGHLLLSFRNNSLLAILDPATGKITWASYGPWRNQHDPRFMDDGTVVMFDNEGHLGPGGASRIIRVDLPTQAILWQYAGSEEEPLYSEFASSVDPLPNGNILITESMTGRLLEVTPDGEIVWDYRTAARVEYEGKILVPSFFRGRRFLKGGLPFLEGSS